MLMGSPVAQSVECWTRDWKVAGSNPGLEGTCGAISIFSAHKTEAPSQSPNAAGLLN